MDLGLLRGAVAVSSNGSIAIIHRTTREDDGSIVYHGLSFSGHVWKSRRPRILAYSVAEYVAGKVENEVANERKSYLDSVRRLKRKSPKTEEKSLLSEVIDTINARAAERREGRRLAPVKAGNDQADGQIRLVDYEEFNVDDAEAANTALLLYRDGVPNVAEPAA